ATYPPAPLSVGLRPHRPPTDELYAFVDEFVAAVQEVFPNCCLHFEDWTGVDAIALLDSPPTSCPTRTSWPPANPLIISTWRASARRLPRPSRTSSRRSPSAY